MPERLRPLLPAVLLIALLASCSRSTAPVVPASETPAATSAAGAVRLLQWAVNTGHAGVLEGLLSADFELAVAGLDSAGNTARVDVPRDGDGQRSAESVRLCLAQSWSADITSGCPYIWTVEGVAVPDGSRP